MEPKKRKKKAAVIIISSILGIAVCVGIWWSVISGVTGEINNNSVKHAFSSGNSIDVIYVQGEIGAGNSLFSEALYNHKWTIDQIDALMNSSSNKAILLYVNSPGGGVYESDELYLKLKQYKEVTGRPVYAYMAQMAASGGLYISMAADKIYANRMTMTGSIGVIMSTMDTTELEKKIGIKTENVVSGRNKAMGNPLTKEQRQILQDMVNETYDTFVQIVSENRKISIEKTKEIADGRVYTANQALKLGLIDKIGNFDTAISELKKDYKLENCVVNDVVSEKSFFNEIFGTAAKKMTLFSEFDDITKYIKANKGIKLMYYYQ